MDSWQRHDFELVESRDAIAFGPECDAARLGEGFVEAGKYPYPVERDGEFVVYGPNGQRMPTARCNIRVEAYDLLGLAAAYAGEKNPVPQRIHLNEIIVLRAAQPHGDPATPI